MGSEAAKPGKRSRIFLYQLRKTVIGHLRQLRRFVRRRHHFYLRRGQRKELLIFAKLVHGPEPEIQILDHRDVLDALAQVFEFVAQVNVTIKVLLGEEVVEDVDFHDGK